MTMSDEDAAEYLRQKLRAMRELGAGPAQIDAATAQSVLHEDLGYYRSKTADYDLDQGTRDKLLAHARQDAAHSVYAAVSVGKELRRLRMAVYLLIAFVAASIIANIWQTWGAG